MTPEQYLQQYCAVLPKLPEVKIADHLHSYAGFTALDAAHYYPPDAVRAASLDTLQRRVLLQLLQDILYVTYPQQKLSYPLASNCPKILQELIDAHTQCNQDREMLQQQLAQTQEELARMQAEMCNYREQASILSAEINKLYISNSWRCTKPLRWLGRVLSAMYSPDTRVKFD